MQAAAYHYTAPQQRSVIDRLGRLKRIRHAKSVYKSACVWSVCNHQAHVVRYDCTGQAFSLQAELCNRIHLHVAVSKDMTMSDDDANKFHFTHHAAEA